MTFDHWQKWGGSAGLQLFLMSDWGQWWFLENKSPV